MIIITGATAGIGEATAKLFAERGHALFLIARRKERLEALARSLKSDHGAEVHFEAMDLRDGAAIQAFSRQHSETLQSAKVLVNNAGLAKGLKPIQEVEPDEWDEMIDTNVKGLLGLTRAILPHFIRRGSGHIVNLGSVAGHYNYPKGNIYCATKAAVHALNESMRIDLLGTGIRVTEVSPGMVETEFSEVRLGDREKAKSVYQGMTPLTARDIAETIYWCVDRPSHVNIQEVVIYPTDQASPTQVFRRS